MEESERPTKMRKLDKGIQHTSQDASPHFAQGDHPSPVFQEANDVHIENANHKDDVRVDESVITDDPKDGSVHFGDLPGPEAVPLPTNGLTYEGQPISKNQLKKILKKQQWDAKRDERKVVRKEKLIAKRQRKRDQRIEHAAQEPPSVDDRQPTNGVLSKSKPQKSVTLPITIMIDCDFDDLMRDNERISLGAQLTRSYSDNKNSTYRAHLAVCSFGGKLRERFEGTLAGMYKSWRGVRFLDDDFVESSEKAKAWMSGEQGGQLKGVFCKYDDLPQEEVEKLKQDGETVYLSSESDDTLSELKPFSTYIIGGLVDKNREKGICYKRATKAGVRTAKLPIGEFMDMQSRKVLATNHVNEILLKWLETGDWGEAFFKVIPKRKGGTLKVLRSRHGQAQDQDDGIYGTIEESGSNEERSIIE